MRSKWITKARISGVLLALCATGFAATSAQAQGALPAPGPTAAAIKQRGQLNCGIDTGIPGFAYQDGARKWQGLDVDYCRAIAAALLGDVEKVRFVPTTTPTRFTLLQSGDIDVLIRDSTHTFSRNASLSLQPTAVNFYAGQSFMVRKSLNVAKAAEMNGATICTLAGSSLELNIGDFARANNIKIATLTFDKSEEAAKAAEAGRCDGYSDDTGSLAAVRSTMQKVDDWMILPDNLSKEPLGPYVRSGDDRWRDIVYWVDAALKTAEEYEITRDNIESFRTSTKPAIRRFLGLDAGLAKMIGLDDEWVVRVIKAVGNYGELYDMHFGAKGLQLPRGQNNLYSHGGLHYPLPFR
ncbi:general L-amino acid transport system substrate-binding protein [Bosea sp. OK403]|nr:general L-amino acid transport system substrate-binding protein [Bosea sp. OK403]